MIRFLFLASALLLSASSCGDTPVARRTTPVVMEGAFEYIVRMDAALSTLDVTVCFPGEPPERLVAGQSSSAGAIRSAEVRTPGEARTALATEGRSLWLRDVGFGGCAGYVIPVERLMSSRWDAMQHGDSVLLNSAAWLWRPSNLDDDGSWGTLRFETPEGIDAAACWPMVGDAHRIDRTTFQFLSHTVFGSFETEQVAVPGAELSVVMLSGELEMSRQDVLRWLEGAAQTTAELLGRFPVEHAQITVVPAGPGDSPVAFGNVGRGGGASVMLILRRNASLEDLADDWVTPHEFSHLSMPYVTRRDAWLSEGFATYYQEVLRARSGLQTPQEAWLALQDGFDRGRSDGTGRTLARESQDMYQTHAFRRVYWSGTAIALLLDVALRRRSEGVLSLDDAIDGLLECCVDPGEVWTAREVIRSIDRLAGDGVFAGIANPQLRSRNFPDLDRIFTFLGLGFGDDGLLVDDDAPGAGIRDAIMAPVLSGAQEAETSSPDP